jgi:hypothetical protein
MIKKVIILDNGYLKEKIDDNIEYLTITHTVGTSIEIFEIDETLLPSSLECLVISTCFFDVELDLRNFTKLKAVMISSYNFNKSIKLPEQLEILEIHSSKFNKPLDFLPNNLLTLKIVGNCFNQKLDDLPFKLSDLKIKSNNFNQSIKFLEKELKIKPYYFIFEIESDTINFKPEFSILEK